MSFGVPRQQFGPALVTASGHHRFVDHTSRDGISSYIGRRLASVDDVLPPLFPFQIYVTYGPTLDDPNLSLAQDFVERAMCEMNKHGQFDYPIRFDFFFASGSDVDAVIGHYHGERKALPDYSKRPGDSFCGLAILLSRETWVTEGVDLVLFDPPAKFLQMSAEEREASLGPGVSEDGVLVIRGVSVQQGQTNGLSTRLRSFAQGNQKWDQLKEQYDEAVLQGHVAW